MGNYVTVTGAYSYTPNDELSDSKTFFNQYCASV